jgi:hypothetical protein
LPDTKEKCISHDAVPNAPQAVQDRETFEEMAGQDRGNWLRGAMPRFTASMICGQSSRYALLLRMNAGMRQEAYAWGGYNFPLGAEKLLQADLRTAATLWKTGRSSAS